MGPVVVVVADVFPHQTFEMSFVEDDDVIEQISAATAHEAFCYSILPRAAEAGPLRLDSEAPDGVDDIGAKCDRERSQSTTNLEMPVGMPGGRHENPLGPTPGAESAGLLPPARPRWPAGDRVSPDRAPPRARPYRGSLA